MNQHVYNPLLNNFKSILDRTRIYSDKSVSNLDMYCLFFRIKLEQEQKRCQNMQNGKSRLAKQFNNNLLLDEVYLNQKSVVLEMVKRVNSEADRLAAFCQPLQQASNKIKNLLSKSKTIFIQLSKIGKGSCKILKHSWKISSGSKTKSSIQLLTRHHFRTVRAGSERVICEVIAICKEDTWSNASIYSQTCYKTPAINQ